MILLGAHLSTQGGLVNCFQEAKELSCTTFQIFTRNQLRWKSKPIHDDEAKEFSGIKNKFGIAFSHASYLINLATDDKKNNFLSKQALADELCRAELLGLEYVVVHTGSAGNQDKKAAIKRFLKATDEAIKMSETKGVKLLLETSAGQGNGIGTSFDEMNEMFFGLKLMKRCGICFDTCHVFASGYDISSKTGWDNTIGEFNDKVGIKHLMAFHLNDSRKPVGSRVDRHHHIGKGYIGLDAFRCIMKDKRFNNIPKVLETPKEDDMDKKNLGLLRKMVAGR